MRPRRSSAGLSQDGSSSPGDGPRRRRVASGIAACGLLFAGAGGAFLATPGQSASSLAAQASMARGFPGGPYFALACGFSHRNNDDSIVFPGQPGRSHNHTYIGNRAVDASTTPLSLLAKTTTCESESDSSAYWFPTLYVGTEAVHPLTAVVYYVKRTVEDVSPPPAGLKMVAGNADARTRQPKGTVAWSCGGVGGPPRFYSVRACADDQLLQLQVNFPNCWNGKTLDSADHKRHLAYASAGRCPASHPTALPTIALILLYPPMPADAKVASGRFGMHADFMNGWDQAALAKLVAGLN